MPRSPTRTASRRTRTPGRPAAGTHDHRETLIDAAREQFAAHGFAATSLRQIALAAKVTPALSHYYFKDKAGLLDGSDKVYSKRPWTITEVTTAGVASEAEEVYENTPLPLDLGLPEQLTLSVPAAKRSSRAVGRKATAAADLAKRVPLASLDDWITFAEALIGRTDIPAESLVPQFTSLDEMDAYERVLGDAMAGDPTLFAREDYVEEAWRIFDPMLKASTPIHEYEPGAWGPPEANRQVSPPGGWRDPSGPA